jgi:NAD(P)-dependent dehydrogenase (short-subunit alcohol dehydrogenase family)
MSVWFITGCSTGLGREVAQAALARGNKVVATARNVSKLKGLEASGALVLPLDVTSKDSEVEEVVAEATNIMARLIFCSTMLASFLKGLSRSRGKTSIFK